MNLTQYLNAWHETYIKPILRPNTAACYMRAIRSLPDDVACLELADPLLPMAIQRAINAKATTHPRAAQLIYTVLHAAMAKAVRLGMVAANPLNLCEKPKHRAKQANVLTVAQLGAYLRAAEGLRTFPLLLLMALCGLRRSEALGLKLEDIDPRGFLHIQRQRLNVKGHGMQLVPLKSRASKRVLAVSDSITGILATWSAMNPPNADGLICAVSAKTLAKDHARAIRAAGLPHVTPHGLRHSLATALVEAGTPIKGVQVILGHSKYQLTADLYADHLKADVFAADMAKLCEKVLE